MKAWTVALLTWKMLTGADKPSEDVAVDSSGGIKVAHHYQVTLQGDLLDDPQTGLLSPPKYLRTERTYKEVTRAAPVWQAALPDANSKTLHTQKAIRDARRNAFINKTAGIVAQMSTAVAIRKKAIQASQAVLEKVKASVNRTLRDDCQSTLNWYNGDPSAGVPGYPPINNPSSLGYTCANYLQKYWCTGNAFVVGAPKGGSSNYPEANCCECGWAGPYQNMVVGQTGVGVQLRCADWTCSPGWSASPIKQSLLGAGNYACCTPGAAGSQCISNPHWHDGDSSDYQTGLGYICEDYAAQGWCNGKSGSRIGFEFNFPAHNCCECGWDGVSVAGKTGIGIGTSQCSDYICPPGFSPNPFVVEKLGSTTTACCMKASFSTCVSFGYSGPDPSNLWNSKYGGCSVLVLNGLCSGNSAIGDLSKVDNFPLSNCCECGWNGTPVEGQTGVGAGMALCMNFNCPSGYSTNLNTWVSFGASTSACCLKAVSATCVSTPTWQLGTIPNLVNDPKITSLCLAMPDTKYRQDGSAQCTGHGPTPGDKSSHPQDWGADFNYPESNCCECGWNGIPVEGQTGLGVGLPGQICQRFTCGRGYSSNPFV